MNSKAHYFNFKHPLNTKIMYFFFTFHFSVVNEIQTNSMNVLVYENCVRHFRILLNVEIIKIFLVFFLTADLIWPCPIFWYHTR